jgi:hypothetical protein
MSEAERFIRALETTYELLTRFDDQEAFEFLDQFLSKEKQMSNDMGGPAFPHTIAEGVQGDRNFPDEFGLAGMTLWDAYAMHALSGLMADSDCDLDPWGMASQVGEYADAMLKERKKRLAGKND